MDMYNKVVKIRPVNAYMEVETGLAFLGVSSHHQTSFHTQTKPCGKKEGGYFIPDIRRSHE